MIRTAENKEAYPFSFDVTQSKLDFATVMAILEEASAKEETEYEQVVVEPKTSLWNDLKRLFTFKYARHVGSAAAVTLISTVAVSAIS